MRTKRETIRVNGKLKEVLTLHDDKGNVLQRIVSPLMVEFYPRDLIQIMIGAALLATPIAFTEETWVLGLNLPMINIFAFALLSIAFISIFVYYNYYRKNLKKHLGEFFKRVFATYFFSFLVVALLLTLIQKAIWRTDFLLALKRTVLVAFPASMSAAIADMIK